MILMKRLKNNDQLQAYPDLVIDLLPHHTSQLQQIYHKQSPRPTLQQKQNTVQLFYNLQFLKQSATYLLGVVQKMLQNFQNQATGQNKIPELTICHIKIIEPQLSQGILRTANKLKIMASKCLLLPALTTKQKYLHLQLNYLDCIRNTNQTQMQENSAERANRQLLQIRKKYKIINKNFIQYYRWHTTSHLHQPEHQPCIFYVNFYVDHLLFINDEPINFNSNLLYCPLILGKINKAANPLQDVEICEWYKNQLLKEDSNWHNYEQYLIFKDRDQRRIILISKMAVFKNKKLRYETFKNLPLHMLKRIRAYVYLRSIWAWIDTVCSNRNSCNRRTSISITINQKVSFEITTVNPLPEDLKHRQAHLETTSNHFPQKFLSFFSEQKIKKMKVRQRDQAEKEFLYFLKKLFHNIQKMGPPLPLENNNFRYYYDGDLHRKNSW